MRFYSVFNSELLCSLLLGCIIFQIKNVSALIPEVCAYNVTQSSPVCCPRNPYNREICGGTNRGYCQEIITPNEFIPYVFRLDDRISWPRKFFRYACQCKGNYYGVSCESCWFGWKGRKCNKPDNRIRRDIRSLSKRELSIFKDVVRRSQNWPSGYVVLDESTNFRSDPLTSPRFEMASIQYFITFNHRYGSRSTLYKNEQDCQDYGILNFNHDGVVFPTWHRYQLLVWERLLAQIAYKVHRVKGFTVPYWDWVGLKECDICTNKYIGGPGVRDEDGLHISSKHPFHNLTEFCYEPQDGMVCYGCQKAGRVATITREFRTYDFPDQRDVEYAMNLKKYFVPGERTRDKCEAFHMALEGFCGRPDADPTYRWLHNKVHVMIDGSMCCSATATNDPIFLLHHAFVDKLFNFWLKLRRPKLEDFPNSNVRPGHSRDSFLIGLMPLARSSDMFCESSLLGYEYDDKPIGHSAQNRMPPIEYPK